MIKQILSLLWILYSVKDGVSQYFVCPYENGLYYATSPDCLIYYRCQDQKLWSGVCFPWQRFDVHSLSCRYVESVVCNPEYAGIWIPFYGEESNVVNEEAKETNQVMADSEMPGAAVDNVTEGEGIIQEDPPINNEAEQEELLDAIKEGVVANQGGDFQEELTGQVVRNEPHKEMDNKETTKAEEDTESKNLQGEQQKEDKGESNEENQVGLLEEKDKDDESELNKDTDANGENINPGNAIEENKVITENGEDSNGEMNILNNTIKLESEEEQNDKEKQQEKIAAADVEQNEQENTQVDKILASLEEEINDEQNNESKDIPMDNKMLPTDLENVPIGRESIVPDLMSPIVTSVFIEESPTETKDVSENVDQKENCQSSTSYYMEPYVESTTPEGSKQEDSSGRFWYWCGSGRFVMTQSPQDPNTICLQLEDPEFIDQEGTGAGTPYWAGHTFLGSDTSV